MTCLGVLGPGGAGDAAAAPILTPCPGVLGFPTSPWDPQAPVGASQRVLSLQHSLGGLQKQVPDVRE